MRTNAGFVDQIRHHASVCRLQGTAVGDFLSSHLEELASLVRWTGAKTPAEHADRLEAWDSSPDIEAEKESSRCGETDID
jgi:hypothetical protein